MAKKHIRILSINGGGIRGYIPALILDQISKESGQDITQLFDMVIGTSIGGMLSAAYTTPMDLKNQTAGPKYNTSEILDLMLRSRNEIFPQNSLRNQLVKAKYPREGLDNFLINEFTINGQPALLKDTLLPIAVTALNEKNNDPQIWSSCSKYFYPMLKLFVKSFVVFPIIIKIFTPLLSCFGIEEHCHCVFHWLLIFDCFEP